MLLFQILADKRVQPLGGLGRDQPAVGDDGILQGAAAAAAAGSLRVGGRQPDDLLGHGHILVHHGQDGIHRNRLVGVVPAVVVGGQGDHTVADLGLTGQLGLGQVGHADDVAPKVRYMNDSARVEKAGPSMQM